MEFKSCFTFSPQAPGAQIPPPPPPPPPPPQANTGVLVHPRKTRKTTRVLGPLPQNKEQNRWSSGCMPHPAWTPRLGPGAQKLESNETPCPPPGRGGAGGRRGPLKRQHPPRPPWRKKVASLWTGELALPKPSSISQALDPHPLAPYSPNMREAAGHQKPDLAIRRWGGFPLTL